MMLGLFIVILIFLVLRYRYRAERAEGKLRRKINEDMKWRQEDNSK